MMEERAERGRQKHTDRQTAKLNRQHQTGETIQEIEK